MDLSHLRFALLMLADRCPAYSGALRDAGFACCHVDDDWIARNCSAAEKRRESRYAIEYTREALASDSPAAIVYNDSLNCRSPWLNDLKAARLREFGATEEIKVAERPDLIQLTPWRRRLARISDAVDSKAERQLNSLIRTFEQRRAEEMSLHRSELHRLLREFNDLGSSPDRLQTLLADELCSSLERCGARTMRTMQNYGEKETVLVGLGAGVELVLLPQLFPSGPWEGNLGIGFRLDTQQSLGLSTFVRELYVVLHLHALLPKELADYGRYANQ